MSNAPEIAYLKAMPLFAGLDPMRLEVLAFTAERQHFEAGATLFLEGSEADAAYLIMAGEAVLLDHDAAGRARARRLDPGAFVGEASLFRATLWEASLRAVTSLDVLRINRDMFHRLLGEFPEMASQMISTLADQLETIGQALAEVGGKQKQ